MTLNLYSWVLQPFICLVRLLHHSVRVKLEIGNCAHNLHLFFIVIASLILLPLVKGFLCLVLVLPRSSLWWRVKNFYGGCFQRQSWKRLLWTSVKCHRTLHALLTARFTLASCWKGPVARERRVGDTCSAGSLTTLYSCTLCTGGMPSTYTDPLEERKCTCCMFPS